MDAATKCADALSHLLEYACLPEFQKEMAVAKELYAIATGKVNDDDPFFETRVSLFHEFFIFDFRLEVVFPGSTVFETFLLNSQQKLSKAELTTYEEMRSFHHSLFLVQKVTETYLMVKNLLSKSTHVLFNLPNFSFVGFESGQVFEGRLISCENAHFLTGAVLFHPKDVTPLIEGYVKDFLRTLQKERKTIRWKDELVRRKEILAAMDEQRLLMEQASRKRSVDFLNVTKNLAPITQMISSPDLIMTLGETQYTSAFVPETPLFFPQALIHKLSYCEIQSHRYRHLELERIYTFNKADAVRPASVQRLAVS